MLVEARDTMEFTLAETWKRLTADYFSYFDVAETMIAIEVAMSGGRYRRAMVESFAWREIGQVSAGSRLAPPGPRDDSPLGSDSRAKQFGPTCPGLAIESAR